MARVANMFLKGIGYVLALAFVTYGLIGLAYVLDDGAMRRQYPGYHVVRG